MATDSLLAQLDPNTRIIMAMYRKKPLDELIQLYNDPAVDKDFISKTGKTFYQSALQFKAFEFADYILRARNIDVNKPLDDGTPLIHSVIKDNDSYEVIDYLAKRGADMTVLWNGDTPFMTAFKLAKEESLKYFIDHGVSPDTVVADLPLIAYFSMKGDYYIVIMLLKVGANPNVRIKSAKNCTPLHLIVTNKEMDLTQKIALIKSLKVANADMNARFETGETALHLACMSDDTSTATALMANGADIDAKARVGTTAAHIAAERNNTEILKELVFRRANINSRLDDGTGRTPLDLISSKKSHFESAKVLIDAGADLYNKVVKSGANAKDTFSLIALTGYPELMRYIHENKRLNASEDIILCYRSSEGFMLTHIAAMGDNIPMLDYLDTTALGWNLGIYLPDGPKTDAECITPIRIAAAFSKPTTVQHMLDSLWCIELGELNYMLQWARKNPYDADAVENLIRVAHARPRSLHAIELAEQENRRKKPPARNADMYRPAPADKTYYDELRRKSATPPPAPKATARHHTVSDEASRDRDDKCIMM